MNIEIRLIKKEDYLQAHQFQCEYLDKESYENFLERIDAHPDVYFVALHGEHIIGVCYGHPSKHAEHAMQLQGIAVNLDPKYARKGTGSKMLKAFEGAARNLGYNKIDVGSADDTKVEKFYVKNGFIPYEVQAKGDNHFLYEKQEVENYDDGLSIKKTLREKHKPKEVIFIMRKSLS